MAKCTCGSKYTSNPKFHYPWCDCCRNNSIIDAIEREYREALNDHYMIPDYIAIPSDKFEHLLDEAKERGLNTSGYEVSLYLTKGMVNVIRYQGFFHTNLSLSKRVLYLELKNV